MVDSPTLYAPKSEIGLYFQPGEPFEVIKAIVSSMGHEVNDDFDTFLNQREGGDLLPDMAIMDEHHAANIEPGEKRWSFIQKRATFLPILVALNDPRDFGSYLRRGFHDCLRLPFEESEVESRILTFLSLKNRTKELIGELEGERHLLATALRVVDDAVIIIDAKGRIVFVNNSFLNITGRRAEELLGLPLKEIVVPPAPDHHDHGSLLAQEVHEFVINGRTQRGHIRLLKKDGSYIELNASVTPLSNKHFKGPYHVIVLRDLSEERLIGARSLQAQKLEALGILASGIAHDFNNILTPIMGYAELLLTHGTDEKVQKEGLEHILTSATRAKELVGELLSFSRRSDEGKRHFNPVPVAKEVVKLLRAAVPENIEIVHNISPNCPNIFLSPVELHQVVMNLVTNAYQAIGDQRPGRIEVSLEPVKIDPVSARTHPGLRPGPHVRLSVSDNGPGIPHSILGKIFDPYFTTKEEGKGTGLGLSVVHNIVRGAHGVVTVYSENGKGATFRCYFPASTVSEDQSYEYSEEAPLDLSGLRVIVVDDDELNLAITCEMFSHLGCSAEAFKDPEKALNRIKKRPKDFDLLFTDQIMPKMSGMDLAKAVKDVVPYIKTVLCSGYPVALSKKDLKEARVRCVLSKPFTLTELKKALTSLTDDAKAD